MTNENQPQNPEAPRSKRFKEAFHRVFGSMVTTDKQYLAENSKTKYVPSEATQAARREQLHQMVREQRTNGSQSTDTTNMVKAPELTAQDHQDLEWLRSGERTGTEVVQAIEQSKPNPEQ